MCLGNKPNAKGRLTKMKKSNRKKFCIALCVLIAFVIWTIAIRFIDVQNIGPQKSSIGLATINKFFHNLTGVHMSLYTITDWLSLIPLMLVIGFATLGFIQWIKRKSLLKVDYSIIILGGFYIILMMIYALFEIFIVNYRPVLIDGILEASYPSSTTMLVMCVMPTAIMQFNTLIKNKIVKLCISSIIIAFTIFMVIGRLISGVHWLTDIIGAALLSTGRVLIYNIVIYLKDKR